jgi:4-oxalocrotonate tautomerase
MPIVQIHILEGRSLNQKRKLVRSVTEAICNSLEVPADKVRIIITDMPQTNYAIAGDLTVDTNKSSDQVSSPEQEVE